MEKHFYQDSHLHLTDPNCPWQVDDSLTLARSGRILRFFSNTAQESEWQQAVDLGSLHSEVIPFIGIHPWFSDNVAPDWDKRLKAHLQTNWCGIGEIGLDKKCGVNESVQEKIFVDQLIIGCTFNRPITIHCLGTWGKLLALLQTASIRHQLPPIMIHAYSGSVEMMHQLVAVGCQLSFSPDALNHPKTLAVLKKTPLTHLLLETDAPNQVHRSCTNYTPEILIALYHKVAQLHTITVKQLAQQLWKNGSLFSTRSPYGPRKTE